MGQVKVQSLSRLHIPGRSGNPRILVQVTLTTALKTHYWALDTFPISRKFHES